MLSIDVSAISMALASHFFSTAGMVFRTGTHATRSSHGCQSSFSRHAAQGLDGMDKLFGCSTAAHCVFWDPSCLVTASLATTATPFRVRQPSEFSLEWSYSFPLSTGFVFSRGFQSSFPHHAAQCLDGKDKLQFFT